MADKQLAALERLTGKLTALRKTLRGEERALLDKMVLSLSAEVTPHGAKADSKTAEGKAAGKLARINVEANEVSVHSSRVEKQNADSKTSQKQMRSTPGSAVSEIELHGMKIDRQNADSKTAGKQAGAVARIAIDLRQGAYQITID